MTIPGSPREVGCGEAKITGCEKDERSDLEAKARAWDHVFATASAADPDDEVLKGVNTWILSLPSIYGIQVDPRGNCEYPDRSQYHQRRGLVSEHLKPEVTGRGFKWMPTIELDDGDVSLYESSLATEAQVWLVVNSTAGGTRSAVGVPLNKAREIAEQLLWLCDNHYQTEGEDS